MKVLLILSLFYSSYSFAKCMAGADPVKCEPMINDPKYKIPKVDYSITENVQTPVMAKMKADFEGKLNGNVLPALGDSMTWASGTLTRTKKGELRYATTTPTYYATTLTAATDLNQLAHESSAINDQLISDYGVDLANNNAVAQNALKERIDEVATKGVGTEVTKENPLALGNGLSAYNKDGSTVFQKKKDDIKIEDLKKTNEYKALVGANVTHTVTSGTAATSTAKSATTTPPTNIGNLDYICKAKDSSMMMLVQAAEQYKNKTITKDQFVEVAVTVSKMGDYNNNVANTINEKGINLPAPSTPGVVGTSTVVTSSPTSCLVNNACVPYVPCGSTTSSSSSDSGGSVSK